MNLYSLVFYHPERGFLLGVNQEGKFDVMTGEWSDYHDPTMMITTLLNAEMLLYEIFYIHKRFGYDGSSYDLEGMRRKYMDLDEEMFQMEIPMESQMLQVIQEWYMNSYRKHVIDMGNEDWKHRYIILDVSLLDSMEDVSMWMHMDLFYQQVMKKVKVEKQMVKWEWKRWKEVRPWKSSDVLLEIREFLDMGVKEVSY